MQEFLPPFARINGENFIDDTWLRIRTCLRMPRDTVWKIPVPDCLLLDLGKRLRPLTLTRNVFLGRASVTLDKMEYQRKSKDEPRLNPSCNAADPSCNGFECHKGATLPLSYRLELHHLESFRPRDLTIANVLDALGNKAGDVFVRVQPASQRGWFIDRGMVAAGHESHPDSGHWPCISDIVHAMSLTHRRVHFTWYVLVTTCGLVCMQYKDTEPSEDKVFANQHKVYTALTERPSVHWTEETMVSKLAQFGVTLRFLWFPDVADGHRAGKVSYDANAYIVVREPPMGYNHVTYDLSTGDPDDAVTVRREVISDWWTCFDGRHRSRKCARRQGEDPDRYEPTRYLTVEEALFQYNNVQVDLP